MAHFAEVDSQGIVKRVIVVDDAIEARGEIAAERWIAEELGLGGTWVQTSFTGRIRERFAGPGFEWHADLGAFVPPKPAPDWELDREAKMYKPAAEQLGG